MNKNLPFEPDGFIFDIDGTIWDATERSAVTYNQAFELKTKNYTPLTAEDLKNLFGKPVDEIRDIVFKDFSFEDRQEMIDYCRTGGRKNLLADPPPAYEGLEDTLKKLYGKYPLFIVSNCQAGYIDTVLSCTGLGKYFIDGLCPADTGKYKADNIRIMAEKHHLANPAYVGDTRGDEIACREAGVLFFFASYGYGTAESPDLVLKDPGELGRIFEE